MSAYMASKAAVRAYARADELDDGRLPLGHFGCSPRWRTPPPGSWPCSLWVRMAVHVGSDANITGHCGGVANGGGSLLQLGFKPAGDEQCAPSAAPSLSRSR
ncbi:hypothetical protein ABT275_36985 [Streptomyces sp. NPDC001185]|uniref:hypothetical protein n=1 Tax=Streptomyces sp. NPDC001185 TaxID=3154380 RepID=UPI0033276564